MDNTHTKWCILIISYVEMSHRREGNKKSTSSSYACHALLHRRGEGKNGM